MTWTRNGEDIAGLDDGQEPGAWGGRISRTSLQIIPTSRDNGAIYACRASNNLLDHTISDAVTLNVACEFTHSNGKLDLLCFEFNYLLLL